MLDHYFIRPTTVDRIRASWIGDSIERYVGWLDEQRYAARNVHSRVPILVRFGEFARTSGASKLEDLPAYVEPFVKDWLSCKEFDECEPEGHVAARSVRNPIQQLLRLILPIYGNSCSQPPDPFASLAPDFFNFLLRDRGLRETTLVQYRHYLQRLQDYLRKVDRPLLPDLAPAVLTAFVTRAAKPSIRGRCRAFAASSKCSSGIFIASD